MPTTSGLVNFNISCPAFYFHRHAPTTDLAMDIFAPDRALHGDRMVYGNRTRAGVSVKIKRRVRRQLQLQGTRSSANIPGACRATVSSNRSPARLDLRCT